MGICQAKGSPVASWPVGPQPCQEGGCSPAKAHTGCQAPSRQPRLLGLPGVQFGTSLQAAGNLGSSPRAPGPTFPHTPIAQRVPQLGTDRRRGASRLRRTPCTPRGRAEATLSGLWRLTHRPAPRPTLSRQGEKGDGSWVELGNLGSPGWGQEGWAWGAQF